MPRVVQHLEMHFCDVARTGQRDPAFCLSTEETRGRGYGRWRPSSGLIPGRRPRYAGSTMRPTACAGSRSPMTSSSIPAIHLSVSYRVTSSTLTTATHDLTGRRMSRGRSADRAIAALSVPAGSSGPGEWATQQLLRIGTAECVERDSPSTSVCSRSSFQQAPAGSICKRAGGGCSAGRHALARHSPTRRRSSGQPASPPSNSTHALSPGSVDGLRHPNATSVAVLSIAFRGTEH